MGDSIFNSISNSAIYTPMLSSQSSSSVQNPFLNEVSLSDSSFNESSDDEEVNTYTFLPFTSNIINIKSKKQPNKKKSNMIKFRYSDKGKKVKKLKI